MENPFQKIDQRLEKIEDAVSRLLDQQSIHKSMDIIQPRQEIIFNITELAAYLGCSKSSIHRYKNNRVFPWYQTGRKVFFKQAEVDKALTSEKKGVRPTVVGLPV